jgi:hypothetical protein
VFDGEGVGLGLDAAEAGPPMRRTAPAVRAATPRSLVMVVRALEVERIGVPLVVDGTRPGPGRRCCRAPVWWWISP